MNTDTETENYEETELTGQDIINEWNDCLRRMIQESEQRKDHEWTTFLTKQFLPQSS